MKTLETHPTTKYLKWLAWKCGGMIRDRFKESLNGMKREWKDDETPLTVTDREVNEFVVDRFKHDYPEVFVVGEEGSGQLVENHRYSILLDPVDGTIPFSLGLPIMTFCISLLDNGRPVAAVIYDPMMERMWFGEKGKGSYLWQVPESAPGVRYHSDWSDAQGVTTRLRVSGHSTVNRSNICMIWWKGSSYHLDDACSILMDEGGHWINPASLAYFGGLIASGQFEGSVFPGPYGWETAAMEVIVTEAGGKVTDINGEEVRYGADGKIEGSIVSNGLIHDDLVRIVAKCQGIP